MSSGDPYPDHRFEVDIDSDAVPATGFSDVRGLAVAVEGADRESQGEWAETFERDATWGTGPTLAATGARRPTESPRLELRRGVTDDDTLWDWFQQWLDGTAEPADVRVTLVDSAGDPGRAWVCRRARPVRWRGPTLTAAEPGVATERYELAHDGVELAARDGE